MLPTFWVQLRAMQQDTIKSHRNPPPKRRLHTPAPVRARVVAKHISGRSNRSIANEEGIDRETVTRILSQQEVKRMIAQYQSQLLSMVPRAVSAYDEVFRSDDLRLKAATATKLFEGFQVFSVQEPDAHELDQEQRRLVFLGQLTDMMLNKSQRYGMPLPPELDGVAKALNAKNITSRALASAGT